MTTKKTGILVYVVGPSGSGSILYCTGGISTTRHETESVTSFSYGVTSRVQKVLEVKSTLSTREQFDAMSYQGHFAMEGTAMVCRMALHGRFSLGCLKGAVVVMNGSRAHLPKTLSLVPTAVVIEIFVQHDVLRKRLSYEDETQADIEERLSRICSASTF